MISSDLKKSQPVMEEFLADCDDVIFQKLCLGKNNGINAYAIFTEPTIENINLSGTAFSECLRICAGIETSELEQWIQEGGFGLLNVTILKEYEEAVSGFLSGDVILFLDGMNLALKIPNKGYPGLSVQEADSEKGIRGSDESFGDSVKTNAALLRKRIRSTDLKVKEYKVGVRSQTTVYIMYMDGITKKEWVNEIEVRLKTFRIDRVTDSGVEQQLMSDQEKSPFPQIQSTRRPSFAAEELLEGRIVVIFDNSPEVLLLPSAYQNFLMAADDSYLQYMVVVLIKSLRYMASFLAMTLPGIYLVACSFQNQLLPTDLLLAIIRASIDTPFRPVTQILFMEIAFELLKEAGVRMPGDMGNAIGIVGGLIVGSAAVDAALVSPIVVIIVAFTALCSFSIPSEELNQAFRIVKFGFILVCAALGEVGFVFGLLALTLHLAGLTSLNLPYLSKIQMSLRKPMKQTFFRGRFGRSHNKVRLKEVEVQPWDN